MATPAHSLRVGDWMCLEGRPYQIGDLRPRPAGGRVVHLLGHTPLVLTPHHTVLVYAASAPRG